MKIYDISMTICPDMPVYKKKAAKKPILTVDSDFTSGTVYESRLAMNLHTGTHLDASLHIFPDGAAIDRLALDRVVTQCKVFDFSEVTEKISAEHFEGKDIREGDFILLKTGNSYRDILEEEFIYLDKQGAEYLFDKKIGGIGIDALGIERSQPEHATHKILLGAEIVILEGLRLAEVPEGEYLLVAAPLRIANVEAAPARALLLCIGDGSLDNLIFRSTMGIKR
jgi:arylformamidase